MNYLILAVIVIVLLFLLMPSFGTTKGVTESTYEPYCNAEQEHNEQDNENNALEPYHNVSYDRNYWWFPFRRYPRRRYRNRYGFDPGRRHSHWHSHNGYGHTHPHEHGWNGYGEGHDHLH